jgi:hypothetical protein
MRFVLLAFSLIGVAAAALSSIPALKTKQSIEQTIIHSQKDTEINLAKNKGPNQEARRKPEKFRNKLAVNGALWWVGNLQREQ